MGRYFSVVFLVGVFALGATACDELKEAPPEPYKVKVSVTGDPGQPLPGVRFTYEGKQVAITEPSGSATLALTGEEGSTVSLSVICPTGYKSPDKPLSITLRRMAEPGKIPEYTVSCPPSIRTVVVAIRAEGGANLPVMYLGQQIATTDRSGAAHVLLRLPPGETFQLMLKSSAAPSNRQLLPLDPVATFVVKQSNDVFSFSEKFKVKRRYRRWHRPRHVGPKPL